MLSLGNKLSGPGTMLCCLSLPKPWKIFQKELDKKWHALSVPPGH